MFEYWFTGLKDPQDPKGLDTFSHHGTTYDFLELCCQVAEKFTKIIAGEFVSNLLLEHSEKLAFLRVTDWNFELNLGDQSIKVIKHPR